MRNKAVWKHGAAGLVVAAVGILALVAACTRDENPTGPRDQLPRFAKTGGSCGASYTLITNEDDSVMAK
jgi:hypothetical protein